MEKLSRLLDLPTVGNIFDPLDNYEMQSLYGLSYPTENFNSLQFSCTIMESHNKKEKPVFVNKVGGFYDYNNPISKEELLSIVEEHIQSIEECMLDLLLEHGNRGAVYSTYKEKREAVDLLMIRIGFNPYSLSRKIDFLIMAYCKVRRDNE